MSEHADEYPMDAVGDDVRAWIQSSLAWEHRLTELRAQPRPAPSLPLSHEEPALARRTQRLFGRAARAVAG